VLVALAELLLLVPGPELLLLLLLGLGLEDVPGLRSLLAVLGVPAVPLLLLVVAVVLAMLGLVTEGPAPPSLPPSLATTLFLSNSLLDALGLSPDLHHNLDQACGSHVWCRGGAKAHVARRGAALQLLLLKAAAGRGCKLQRG
jgi:hypothetical protein